MFPVHHIWLPQKCQDSNVHGANMGPRLFSCALGQSYNYRGNPKQIITVAADSYASSVARSSGAMVLRKIEGTWFSVNKGLGYLRYFWEMIENANGCVYPLNKVNSIRVKYLYCPFQVSENTICGYVRALNNHGCGTCYIKGTPMLCIIKANKNRCLMNRLFFFMVTKAKTRFLD